MRKNKNGISLPAVLGVLLVVLKLTDVISWSWFYVTLPFWLPLALLSLVALTLFIGQIFKKK